MRLEPVEIYSDETNRAVLRHPGRRLPGVMIQGDTLSNLCRTADDLCKEARPQLSAEAYDDLNDLRNVLQSLLSHYKMVLGEHAIPLPFSETP